MVTLHTLYPPSFLFEVLQGLCYRGQGAGVVTEGFVSRV